MQALKLIRTIMTVDAQLMRHSLVQSLVSVAAATKDEMRRVALDVLRELG